MPKYQSKYKGNQIDNLLDFVNDNKDNLALKEEIPEIPSIPRNVSELSNDLGFITNTVNNLINYYKKSETYTKSEINTLVSASASGGFIKVNELPTEDINIKAIYLVPYTGSRAKNLYEEYIYVDGDWEMIGTTKIDLSNYVTITALNTALADYLTSDSFNNQIANYYNKTEIAGLLANKIDNNKIGAANGVASLDNDGKVPSSQLPEQQSSGVSDFNDLTNRPQKEVTSIESIIDPVPLPTHNQMGSVGFTPIGTIISIMGTTAPRHYLACDGQIVNISDYPELADYFEEQFGTKNHFGGDGETTFAVPDLRGEFLRGTGTNSHSGNGNGANVGEHQDGTETPFFGFNQETGDIWIQTSAGQNAGLSLSETNLDAFKTTTDQTGRYWRQTSTFAGNGTTTYTSRPTNTSVLYCIATKNIYVDARFDYSTQEKVVGTWIDGKPIYQKIWSGLSLTGTGEEDDTNIDISFVDRLIYGVASRSGSNTAVIGGVNFKKGTNNHLLYNETQGFANVDVIILQYTKTTD